MENMILKKKRKNFTPSHERQTFTLSHVIGPYLEEAFAKKWSITTYIATIFDILSRLKADEHQGPKSGCGASGGWNIKRYLNIITDIHALHIK